jgi:hypothetical protein
MWRELTLEVYTTQWSLYCIKQSIQADLDQTWSKQVGSKNSFFLAVTMVAYLYILVKSCSGTFNSVVQHLFY